MVTVSIKLMGRYARLLFTSVFFIFLFSASAQTIADEEESTLKEFQDTNQPSQRFDVFFNSLDRYNVNSAYDWLDTIKIYLSNAQKTEDTTATRLYKVMQAQVYNDLGEYDKSTALAKELYDIKDSLDADSQRVVLDVLDDNYANLQLFDKQIEIRKQKRELGLTNNVSFYDIYSNLGLYRKARNQYIMEVKPTIADNDSYGLAKYHSKVGNYLRLDDSAPTALSELKKAKAYLDVYVNDISTQKSESDIFESEILKAEIEGNIAKCHVMLGEYEVAIPLLETSIETLRKSSNNKDQSKVVDNTLFLAEANLQMDRFAAAKKHLDVDFDNITVLQTIKKNSLLAAFYDKVENYKNASIYYKRNERIKDSLAKKQSALIKQQLVTIVANEDLENSQRLIDEQKRINELARSEMKAKD